MKGKTVFAIAILISFICHCAILVFTTNSISIKEREKQPVNISIYRMEIEIKPKKKIVKQALLFHKKTKKRPAKTKKIVKKSYKRTETTPLPVKKETTEIVTDKSHVTARPKQNSTPDENRRINNKKDADIEEIKEKQTIDNSHKIYSPAYVSKNSRLLKYVEPKYPEDLIEENIEGQVIFNIVISQEGVPSIISIKKSDDERFNEPAIKAVKNSIFTPAELSDGTKVACKRSYAVTFKLED